MARPNFSTSIGGFASRNSPGTESDISNYWNADCRFCSEVVSGTTRKRKPKGWVAPTNYSLVRREYQRAYGTAQYQTSSLSSSRTTYSGWIGGSGLQAFNSLNHFNECVQEVDAVTALSSNAALVAARNKLKAKRVDLGVAFAERKATSRMLGDTASRIARAVRSLRHGEYRNAARALGIIGDPGRPRGSNWTNHWLQLQYGWKPLLSDVYGSCDALAKRDKDDWRVTVTASRRDADTWKYRKDPLGSSGLLGNYDACSVVAERKRGVFVRLDAIPSNDLTISLVSLGVTNPLLVAWELVPYSFVVDWFLPVGAWLDSLDALLGYGPCYSSISSWTEVQWVDVGISKTFANGSFVKNNYRGTKRVLEVKRTGGSGVPFATFPRFKDPRSLGHMANGLSLLAQAFAR